MFRAAMLGGACALALSLPTGAARAEIELTLNFPVAVGGPITAIIDEYARQYSEQTDGVTVTAIYTGSYQDTITRTITQFRGGTAPDMAVLLSVDTFTLYDEDMIVPVSELATTPEEQAWLESFYPAFLENGFIDGMFWGVPFQRSTPVLYWNKEAFAAAGLDPEVPPATWEEQVTFAEQLTVRDDAGNVTQYGIQIPTSGFPYWLFQGLTTQNDVILMNSDGNEVNFDDPRVVEALDYLISLSQEHEVMAPGIIEWGTTPQDFFQGRTAMMWTTTGNLTNVRNNAPFDFGVAMLPANVRRGAPTGGGNLFILRSTPEREQAALDFIRWLTTPEMQADWSIKTGYVATSPAAFETEAMEAYVADFPPAAVARDQLEFAVAELSTHENQRVTKVLNDALQAALTGEAAPADALAEAQEEAMRILAPYR
ncbi:MAG: ABC transporter substrate-binding protein [Pseudomonadota bacterium]